ncbi:winged helix-turn-helix domain-containing protein [Streptomyces chattanoogensis]|uniref:winged helix-turn-helix domain-containing protein n=1 Tax=Streptomyces chattanoogensis TaxID=66876 RepID=UPI0007C7FD6C
MQRWRRAWAEGGLRALRSQGPASLPRLSEAQFAQLEREPAKGPTAHGWEDRRRTLARVKTLIGRLFCASYTVESTWQLLKWHGWSWQQPVRRAIERDQDAVEVWKKEEGGVAQGTRTVAALRAWIVFEDEAGQSLRPPRARTWAGRLHRLVAALWNKA